MGPLNFKTSKKLQMNPAAMPSPMTSISSQVITTDLRAKMPPFTLYKKRKNRKFKTKNIEMGSSENETNALWQQTCKGAERRRDEAIVKTQKINKRNNAKGNDALKIE